MWDLKCVGVTQEWWRPKPINVTREWSVNKWSLSGMLSAVARAPTALGPRRRHSPVSHLWASGGWQRCEAENQLQFSWSRAWPLVGLFLCLIVLNTLWTFCYRNQILVRLASHPPKSYLDMGPHSTVIVCASIKQACQAPQVVGNH